MRRWLQVLSSSGPAGPGRLKTTTVGGPFPGRRPASESGLHCDPAGLNPGHGTYYRDTDTVGPWAHLLMLLTVGKI